jgi:hypothetical protein
MVESDLKFTDGLLTTVKCFTQCYKQYLIIQHDVSSDILQQQAYYNSVRNLHRIPPDFRTDGFDGDALI